MKLYVNLLLLTIVTYAYPLAVFHGLSHSCDGLKNTETYLKNELETYVVCIETGAGSDSYMTSLEHQYEKGCRIIKENENFKDDFSILGFSQGTLIGRMIIERCLTPGMVKRFVSV